MKITLDRASQTLHRSKDMEALRQAFELSACETCEIAILDILEKMGLRAALLWMRAVKGHGLAMIQLRILMVEQVKCLLIDTRSLHALAALRAYFIDGESHIDIDEIQRDAVFAMLDLQRKLVDVKVAEHLDNVVYRDECRKIDAADCVSNILTNTAIAVYQKVHQALLYPSLTKPFDQYVKTQVTRLCIQSNYT